MADEPEAGVLNVPTDPPTPVLEPEPELVPAVESTPIVPAPSVSEAVPDDFRPEVCFVTLRASGEESTHSFDPETGAGLKEARTALWGRLVEKGVADKYTGYTPHDIVSDEESGSKHCSRCHNAEWWCLENPNCEAQ